MIDNDAAELQAIKERAKKAAALATDPDVEPDKAHAGRRCKHCRLDATEHFQKGHHWESSECPRDKDGKHAWSQSGDGGDVPCHVCGKRNPRFFPEDWPTAQTDIFRLIEIISEKDAVIAQLRA